MVSNHFGQCNVEWQGLLESQPLDLMKALGFNCSQPLVVDAPHNAR